MPPELTILYGNPKKAEVTVSHIKGGFTEPWSDFLQEQTLHILFNLSSKLIIFDRNVRLNIIPGTIAIWHRGKNTSPHIAQLPIEINQFKNNSDQSLNQQDIVIISLSQQWLENLFGIQKKALHPVLQSILARSSESIEIGRIRSMLINEMQLARDLISPPVLRPAMPFWYGAKVIEIVSLHLFTNTETTNNIAFCHQIKSTNQRRISLAIDWLEQRLDQSLDLKSLSKHLDCTPSHLSRIFSEHTGKTLKVTLRRMRIEKAAKLLSDGDYNVTEAALEVGYKSLSHFSKAFLEEKGIKPSKYC